MLSAKLTNDQRKTVYRRDHYRCALCDETRGLQIHHVVPRSQGGTNYPQNLITLCWRCHAIAHGTTIPGLDIEPAEVSQACVEYVADLYADCGLLWNPWQETMDQIAEVPPP